MTRLKKCGHVVDHQVLNNGSRKEYRRHITDIWEATYQLVTPELVRGLPDFSGVAMVLLAGFVVEDLVVNDVAARLDAGHDEGVGRDTVAVLAVLEGFDEDDVGITMAGSHEVLVAAAGADREASCVVCVERAAGFHPDVELSGRGLLGMFLNGGRRRGGEVGFICVRWPLMVSSLSGKYLEALA